MDSPILDAAEALLATTAAARRRIAALAHHHLGFDAALAVEAALLRGASDARARALIPMVLEFSGGFSLDGGGGASPPATPPLAAVSSAVAARRDAASAVSAAPRAPRRGCGPPPRPGGVAGGQAPRPRKKMPSYLANRRESWSS